jgi:competence protein ComGC
MKKIPPPPRGFSLIELLAVIGFIALLTSLSVGALGRHAVSLSAEGNGVVDLVSLAQQHAFGKNRATALVFAHLTDGRQAFAIFQLAPADASLPPTGGDWQPVTPWKFLGPGVALEKGSAANTFLATPSVSPPLIVGAVGGRPVEEIAYQVFLPDSQLVSSPGSSFPTLRLVQGGYRNGQFVLAQKGAANHYDILINPATGRAIVERP